MTYNLLRSNLPCCVFSAIMCIEKKNNSYYLSVEGASSDIPRELWNSLMVMDRKNPWSHPAACQLLVGGTIMHTPEGTKPNFTAGRWHIIQRWAYLNEDGTVGDQSTGHTQAIYYDGENYHVHESGTARGYRYYAGAYNWKSHYTYQVLHLPKGVKLDPHRGQ